jgi:hypothetical protein
MKFAPPDPQLKELQQLNKNIEVVIALLLRTVSRDTNPLALKDQIAILNGLGLRPASIADIVGRTGSHVNKELVGIRRAAKKKAKTR